MFIFTPINDYLEILSDLGYPGFSCLAGVVLISLWQALKALRHRHSSFVRGMGFAGFMGTLSLLMHSSVDYNLQIPANAMLFIAMLAIPTIALSVDKNQFNEPLDKLIPFMVRQAHHERNQQLTVRPEPVEGLKQSFLKPPSEFEK